MDKANVIPFQYNSQDVRVIIDALGAPWWVAKDVCDVLNISEYRHAVEKLDDDERGVEKVHTLGGPQEMIVINQSGLFTLVLRSNKPEARPFRKWITSEVLPAIMQTGEYSLVKEPDPSRHLLHMGRRYERVTRIFRSLKIMARTAGFTGTQAVLRANRVTREKTGFDCLELIGGGDLSAPVYIESFVDDACHLGPDCTVHPASLYDAYVSWCNSHNGLPFGKIQFYQYIVTTYGLRRYRPSGSTVEMFEGIALRKGGDIS